MTPKPEDLPSVFSGLPEEVKAWLIDKVNEAPELLVAYMGISDREIIQEFEIDKNKSKEVKDKELRIKEAHRFKEDVLKFVNQTRIERGFSEHDFEIDLRIKNPELNKQANPISDQRNKQIQVFANLLSGTYELETNFDEKIEDLIDTSRFDYKNSDINSQNFKTERKGRIKQVAYLIHFNKDISSDDAVKELDKLGLRPAELHECLEFSIKYPDIQRQFPIAALGSGLREWRGYVRAPCLSSVTSGRNLRLALWSRRWSGYCRFLALSK